MKMKKILFVALSLLLLLAFGCSHDTNNSSVTNPNPNTVYPKGYIQGIVKDACTQAPIAGAVVDIGIAQATTNSNGQYIMRDIPATSYIDQTEIDGDLNIGRRTVGGIDVDIDSGYRGSYSATINMTNARIGGVKVTNYASYYYDEVEVAFASMEPSSGVISADNADVTPVLGLANGDYDFNLGQLTAGITGYAVDANTLQPVPAGYTVYLFSHYRGNASNSTTGISGNKVAQTTTDATGKFVFTKLEAKQRFGIFVVDTAIDTAKFMGFKDVETDCNGSVLYFGIQDGNAVRVSSTDNVCPFALSIKADGHANYADIAKAEIEDGVNVVFTFSEPILPTELNTNRGLLATTFSVFGADPEASLYYDIAVNYEGYKSSNIHHTLAWNADMTQLTVNIPAEALQPASVYSVKIINNRNLMDYSGHALTNSVGKWSDNDHEYSYYQCAEFTEGAVGITFTTYGARPAGAITDLRFTNADNQDDTQLDYNDGAWLDWTADDGAKSYNIYCRMIQWNTTTAVPCGTDEYTGQYHPYYLYTNTVWTGLDETNFQGPGSNWPDGTPTWFEYVENLAIKLSYECYVVGVDADGIEGPESNHIILEDTDRPHITSVSAAPNGSLVAGAQIGGIEVCFSEPMNEYTVEHATWTVNTAAFVTGTGMGMTVATANYEQGSMCYTITFNDATIARLINSANVACGTGTVDVTLLSVTGDIWDVAGNALQDPCEDCTAPGTLPMLPFTFPVTQNACP